MTFDVKQHFPDKPAIDGPSGPIYSDKIIRKPMYIEGYDLTKNIYVSTVIIQPHSTQA